MIITFTKNIQMDIVKDIQEDHIEFETEVFSVGETVTADIMHECPECVDLQFPNGCFCFGLAKHAIQIKGE